MNGCNWLIDGSEPCGKPCEGKNALCATHGRISRKLVDDARKELEKRELHFSKKREPRATPNKVSPKRKVENEEYSRKREEFLKANPECQAGIENICDREANEVHHMKGRGILLNETKFWLAVCRNCHVYITDHPLDAIKRNLSFSRLSKNETI
jgi:hypothetical protein